MAVLTHRADVVPVVLETHPNADSLSIVRIYNFQVLVKTEDWLNRKVGVYIQPDSMVDVTRPEFSFLKKDENDVKPQRIKVKRLRGVVSMGLLVPAPEGVEIGTDVAEMLGVGHYEPITEEERTEGRGPSASAEPLTVNIWAPKYDIESMYRYAEAFEPGENVHATEKLHGENARYFWDGERMWAGTRKEWKKPGMGGVWKVMQTHGWIESFCRDNPLHILHGELFGWVQKLRYGATAEQYFMRAFDVLNGTEFWNVKKFNEVLYPIHRVPDLGVHRYDFHELQKLAEGNTLIKCAGNTNPPSRKDQNVPIANMREGIVVRPVEERQHVSLGRVIAKFVSNKYLEEMDDR